MQTGAPPAAHARLPEIEVLRGLAVCCVLLHHAHGNLFTKPHRLLDLVSHHVDLSTGVDLFFAISGFVIARSLLPTLDKAEGAAGFFQVAAAFWIRRAWRLLPSAWLWLALILAASAWFNRAGLFGSVSTNAWAAVAGVLDFANFRFANAFGRYPYGASFAWWSLSLEEQFYLLLPPVAFLCRRWLPLLLMPLLLYQLQSYRTLVTMACRTDAVLLGVLLACWAPLSSYTRAAVWLGRLPRVAGPVVTLGLVAALVTRRHSAAPPDVGLMAIFSVALVWLAAQDKGLVAPDGVLRHAMLWVGARSYGLYLIHIPAFLAAREIWFRIGNPGGETPIAATAIFLLLASTELNWRWVEQPLRRHGARIAEGRLRDTSKKR